MKEDILKEAEFLLLDIKDDVEKYEDYISKYVKSMKNLENINLDNLEETHFPFKIDPLLREDVSLEGAELEDLFKNTTNIEGREITIPKVVG